MVFASFNYGNTLLMTVSHDMSYAYSMPGEPVIILHVALVDAISNNIQSIVHHPTLSRQSDFKLNSESTEEPSTFNTAIFYSITSTQPGLKGISFS